MAAADVVEPAVVRLADDGIDRLDALIPGEAESPIDDRVGGHGDAQGVGQNDGRFECAELPDLGHPRELAVAVGGPDPGRDLVLEDIPAMGEDGRDARPDGFALEDGHLTDLDSRYICNGVERAGREDADDETEFPGPRPVLRGQDAGGAKGGGGGETE